MPRATSIILALLAAAPAAAAERRYTVTSFDRVQVDGPYQVRLVTGRPSAATARGSQRALDAVSVEVQGRLLKIGTDRSAWGGYPGEGAGPVTIELSTHELRGAFVRGPGSLHVDKARAMRFDASLSGSGSLAVDAVEADRLDAALVGSGRMELGGKVKTLRAAIQGAGDLAAPGLTADDAQINAGTSGTVEVAVKRAAKVNSSGAGEVNVLGKPACTVDARGSGIVRCGMER